MGRTNQPIGVQLTGTALVVSAVVFGAYGMTLPALVSLGMLTTLAIGYTAIEKAFTQPPQDK